MSIYDIPLTTSAGEQTNLAAYKGKVLYIVNVASKCGLTPQYEGLEALYKKYNGDVAVLGFPANDFLAQEPGSDSDIQEFCTLKYNVTFPLFKKASVIGEDKQPLYAKLIELQPVTIKRDEIINKLKGSGIATTPEPEVAWNFEKFIINKDGTKVQRFSPGLAPNDADIVKTIEEFNQ